MYITTSFVSFTLPPKIILGIICQVKLFPEEGIEPSQSAPKADVLPLYNSGINNVKVASQRLSQFLRSPLLPCLADL